MKVKVLQKDLMDALSIVSRAVSSKTTLPILECILLIADENGFRLVANDLELGIESKAIEATIENEGKVAIEARLFTDIVRRLPKSEVHIEVIENSVSIVCEQSDFKLAFMEGEEFPALPEVDRDNGISISSHQLRNMIRQTIFSVSLDETKPVMTGELFEIKDGILKLVSVDGFRVSYREIPILDKEADISLIIPGKTLEEISRILPTDDEEEKVTFYVTDNHILFELGDCQVVSRLLEGSFIDYESILTEEYSTMVYANKDRLLSALERTSLLSTDARKTPVLLNISELGLELSSKTEMGEAKEEMPVKIDGTPLEIAFNPRYLMDALKVIDEEDISIQLTTPLSPCIIRSEENRNFIYLILPLRIKN